ncbi:MAG: hypothetical protein BWY91_02578 [bacterium ADurb.BinA028]|nr:MAG: hypothetical protein BWY91_02578 [bacterium ADurb.BinA028]
MQRTVPDELRGVGGVLARHGPDRVDRRAPTKQFGLLDAGGAGGPGLDAAVAEPLLHTVERQVPLGGEPTLQVEGVQQGQSDPDLVRCPGQGSAHGVGVGVARAARTVVQVVVFADHGDAGQRHLGEGGPGQSEIEIGVEAFSDVVHLCAPSDSVVRVRLGASAQDPLEDMAMGIGQPGKDDTAEFDILGVAGRSGLDDDEPTIVHDQAHAAGQARRQPHVLGPERRHDTPCRSTRSCSTVPRPPRGPSRTASILTLPGVQM